MKLLVAAILAATFALGTDSASAQTASDRAGELKDWRERCAEPDNDLRIGHIEAAIATADVTVIRICSRLALEADDVDIRNLGLRAAIASVDRIVFDAEMPKVLASAIKAAGSDRKKLAEIEDWYAMMIWNTIQSGLVFEVTEASVTGGSSTWYPLAGLSQRSDNYRGQATVSGSRITWVGRASLRIDDCKLDAKVAAGAELVGLFHCGKELPFPVRASLL